MTAMTDWIDSLYDDIDGMSIDGVLQHFAVDGEVVFGNNPAAIGHAAIDAALGHFWSTIAGMRHEWRNRWSVDPRTAVLEARVHYTTRNHDEITVPCVTVVDHDNGLVSSLRVHIDLAPLFAAGTSDREVIK